MAEYETQYQQLSVYDDDDDDGEDTDNHTEADLMIHVVPEGGKGYILFTFSQMTQDFPIWFSQSEVVLHSNL